MRIFTACLATETNSFAPFPAGMSSFLLGSRENGAESPLFAPMTVFQERATADGHELIESIAMIAMPSGVTVRRTHEDLSNRIIDDLAKAGPIDLVLLMLHGAMVADGCDDCEGALLARIRRQLPTAVIGAVLDPHCHMTSAMVEAADLLIPAQEYPHTDFGLQGEALYGLCMSTARREIKPVPALFDLRMIGLYPTAQPIMRDLYARMAAIRERKDIVSVSLVHGFPWGDVEDMGTRILAYSDGNPDGARDAAVEIGRLLYQSRMELRPVYPTIAQALDRSLAVDGQVVLGDFADNAHGGAPSDSSFFLAAILEGYVGKVVMGAYWDPIVADICADAGVGARTKIRLGGKCGPASGSPVDIDVEVMGVTRDHVQSALGDKQSLGLSVWLRHGDIDLLVCSVRTQIFAPDAFTGVGIDLSDAKLIVVKSMVHYRAAFEQIADHVWNVNTPGAMQLDIEALPYSNCRGTIFPMHEDPWSVEAPNCWTAMTGWRPIN